MAKKKSQVELLGSEWSEPTKIKPGNSEKVMFGAGAPTRCKEVCNTNSFNEPCERKTKKRSAVQPGYLCRPQLPGLDGTPWNPSPPRPRSTSSIGIGNRHRIASGQHSLHNPTVWAGDKLFLFFCSPQLKMNRTPSPHQKKRTKEETNLIQEK